MTEKELELLEDWIDKYSLADVLFGVAEIAKEKADHIEITYDDSNLADEWLATAEEIDLLADSIDLPT